MIHKHVLKRQFGDQVVELQSDEIYSVEEQHGDIAMYAEHSPTLPRVPYKFTVVGTGQYFDLSPEMRFLGTVKMSGGDIMLHVFYQRLF